MDFCSSYITVLMDFSLSSPLGEDEPRTIAIGGRAKDLRIPLMWDAYMQTGGLLLQTGDKTKEKTVKCPLANLQVRTFLNRPLLLR